MPCDSGPAYGERDTRLDEATRAACEMRSLLTEKQVRALSKATQAWIANHDELDRQRIHMKAADAIRQAKINAAKGKLTYEELALLGVK